MFTRARRWPWMSINRGRTQWGKLAAMAACSVLGSCSGPSRDDRAAVRAWLYCEECVKGELDELKARGDDVVDLLAPAVDGPSQDRQTNMQRQLGKTWGVLKNRGPAPDSQNYVNHYLGNYKALYQSRAISGLSAIGTSKAQKALTDALDRVNSHNLTLRGDVEGELRVAVLGRWLAVAAGNRESCGIRTNQQLHCWGTNDAGQLGDGTVDRRLRPTPVQGNLQFSVIALGSGRHACGLADHVAYCWGSNGKGELGDRTTFSRNIPTRVASDSSFIGITVGGEHSCGWTPSNRGLCWGANNLGQLGDGTNAARVGPVFVTFNLGVKTIRAGASHTCADSLNQVLHCWGSNASGQLAIGAPGDRTGPTQAPGPLLVKAVTVGASHGCILTQPDPAAIPEGAAYCVGLNDRGQLGDGSTTSRSQLTKVASGPFYIAISAGQNHTCAIQTGVRIAWCWGDNTYGQLGDGSTTAHAAPAPVNTRQRFLSISAGAGHTCAISLEGLAYCWGRNDIGQLGDGTAVNRSSPTLVQSPTPVQTP